MLKTKKKTLKLKIHASWVKSWFPQHQKKVKSWCAILLVMNCMCLPNHSKKFSNE